MSHDIAPIPALYDPDLEDQPRLVDDQGWMDFSASLDLPQHQPTFALSSYSAQPSMTDHRHARQKQRHDNHYQFLLEHLPRTSSTTSPYFNAGSMSRAIPTFYNPDLEAQPELQGHQGWAQQSWKDFVASLDLPQRHPVVASSSPHFNSGPVHDLQNYLQGYLAGNLMPCFSWSLSQSGPDHLKIHHATALFDGSEIGHGEGVSVDAAQALAAIRALKYLHDNPQPAPPPHPQKGPVHNIKEEMIDWEKILNFPVSS